MITQHIQHADRGQSHPKQVRPLRQGGTDQQPAIATPMNTETGTARVAFSDQVLGSCNKIVEYVLLVGERATFVPGLTILTAPAKVGFCVNATHFEPRQHRSAKHWSQ